MDHIYWLARIFGPFFTIMGIWMLFRLDDMTRVWTGVRDNYAFLYLGGVLNLLIGLTVLSTYSEWSWTLPVLLTIMGWVMLIRGLIVLFAPDWVMERTKSLEPFSKGWAIVPLFFGIGITYLAYFA